MVLGAVLIQKDHSVLGGTYERFVHAHLINFGVLGEKSIFGIGLFVLPVLRLLTDDLGEDVASDDLKALMIGTGLFAIAACSAQPEQPRPEPPLGTLPVINVDADVKFPLDGYLISPERRAIVRKSQDLLVQKCMRRLGFEMDTRSRPQGPRNSESSRRPGPRTWSLR